MKKLLIPITAAVLAISAILAFIFSPSVETVAEEKPQAALPTEQPKPEKQQTQEFATVTGTIGIGIAGDEK